MKRKGFTLIELLAVIIVLAIIALISTPMILKVIEKAEKGSFEDSAYGVLDAAKIYYANMNLDEKGKEETFTFPEDKKLKLSGKKPATGSVRLEEDGKVALAISNGKWCAIKDKDEEKITIEDYSIGECELTKEPPYNSCFTVNETGETITDYICTDVNVVIPNKIKGITITKIGENAFYSNYLKSVTIPNSVTSIGDNAFYENRLQSIEIPNSVMSIGKMAFTSNQLQNIFIPNSVITIFGGAFNNNQLPSGKEFIYARNNDGTVDTSRLVSYGGAKRNDVSIPNGVISIGENAFYFNQLQSVEIPNSVTSIETSAFGKNYLTNVTIPNSVTSIGKGAFNDNRLTSVTIPNRITRIEERVFADNPITSVTIPNSVTSIGKGAFSSNRLTTVTIPSSVISIEQGAFVANRLQSIEIPSSVRSIGDGVFSYNTLYNSSGKMKVIVNKPKNSIAGAPWGATSVEWTG